MDRRNNAQRSLDDPFFEDRGSRTGYEPNNTGGKTRVTRYSDGSSTVHHGGPVGDTQYNEFGEEC